MQSGTCGSLVRIFSGDNLLISFHFISHRNLENMYILCLNDCRWMNSDLPLSHLNGFFLRLRLGNHQVGVGAGAGAGAGGSSYYVACITGEVTENKGCTSRKCISVDVGGIKSSVATQYVSNHDFLQVSSTQPYNFLFNCCIIHHF